MVNKFYEKIKINSNLILIMSFVCVDGELVYICCESIQDTSSCCIKYQKVYLKL